MLEAKHIMKSFGEGDTKVKIINDVSLTINDGEMLYIVGPSGSGKTTLISILSGILRPDAGEIIIDDKDIWKMKDDDLAHFRLYFIGFVFQDFHLFPRLSTQENVAIPLILRKVDWDVALAEAQQCLEIVNLKHRLDVRPYQLSIGEQQRVAIARAIITKPKLLVFDEPTASLDSVMGQKIMTFVKEDILTRDKAIIVVTHDNRIYRYASRILNMEDGKISDASHKITQEKSNEN